MRGKYFDAGCALVSIVPVIGDAVGKGAKGVKIVVKSIDKIDDIADTARALEKSTDVIAETVKVGKWSKGSFDNTINSLEYHFKKHATEVNAKDIDQYLRKAEEFSKNLRGAQKTLVDGAVDGAKRYVKNGKYIDIAPDGTIISFGKR